MGELLDKLTLRQQALFGRICDNIWEAQIKKLAGHVNPIRDACPELRGPLDGLQEICENENGPSRTTTEAVKLLAKIKKRLGDGTFDSRLAEEEILGLASLHDGAASASAQPETKRVLIDASAANLPANGAQTLDGAAPRGAIH